MFYLIGLFSVHSWFSMSLFYDGNIIKNKHYPMEMCLQNDKSKYYSSYELWFIYLNKKILFAINYNH